ncbi:MAG TPA: amidophosphoribosyltransferase, partial [Chloroflexota bacterium]|nr:amidophosphoribosyltransferase [Chloroflexota bacterium]
MAELHEACGVFGIYAPGADVARITFFGLYALQHRGQESAGITTGDGKELRTFKSMGLVVQVFNEEELGFLKGHVAIGHNRYSTTGSSKVCNAQPIMVDSDIGQLALGHNGNLVNSGALAEQLVESGVQLETTTDSELIVKAITTAPGLDWETRMSHAMHRFQGAFSLVMATAGALYAARDPLG